VIKSIVPLKDGKVLVGGSFTSYSGVTTGPLVRLNPDGSLDPTFEGNSDLTSVTSIGLQSDGKVMVAALRGVFRFNSDGTLDVSFKSPDLLPIPNWPRWQSYEPPPTSVVLAIDAWDDVLIAGQFSTVDGIQMDQVARLKGGAFDRKPPRFEKAEFIGKNRLNLQVSGPNNYDAVLESSQGDAWTAIATNKLANGTNSFERATNGDREMFRFRLTRP
jgi:hypothetical protein